MDEARFWWNADEWLRTTRSRSVNSNKPWNQLWVFFFYFWGRLHQVKFWRMNMERIQVMSIVQISSFLHWSCFQRQGSVSHGTGPHGLKKTYILGKSISSGWLCPCREVFHFVTSKFSNATLLLYCLYHHVVPYHSSCSMTQVTLYLSTLYLVSSPVLWQWHWLVTT